MQIVLNGDWGYEIQKPDWIQCNSIEKWRINSLIEINVWHREIENRKQFHAW